MWNDELKGSAYNTTPAQDGKLLKLATTHGLPDFLGGYVLWLKWHAYDQIQTKHGDTLLMPLRKFIEQASTYIEEFRENKSGCRSHKNYTHVFSIARDLGWVDTETGIGVAL
jgi:hypothetical protein